MWPVQSRSWAAAQTVTATTGAVNGVVTDSTRAVVAGVSVSLSGPALITARTTVTGADGAYQFAAIPIGDHIVTFELLGFATVIHSGIHVGLGFTATVNAEIRPGTISDLVTVSGAAPVVDVASTANTTHFDSQTLATLPGARDIFAILANTPGVAMAKMDVGGNSGLSLQDYTAYGLRAAGGINRNEVEGIRVGGANGAADNYISDFASFEEIAVRAVGQSAAMPVPGTLAQYVSKSGGNSYHGAVYADFQNDALEGHNIDASQIARGVSGGRGLAARDVNRLQSFRDFNADAGGFLKRDRLWWYGAYRNSAVAQRYPWLLDTDTNLETTVASGKGTYLLAPARKLVGYVQRQMFDQSTYIAVGTNQPIQTDDALPRLDFPVEVWKGEYTAAFTDTLYLEVRGGGYHSAGQLSAKSQAPRILDVGANTVSGGALVLDRLIDRPQVNGTLSFATSGWSGSHTIRIGGEYMSDRVVTPTYGFDNPCNCVSILNNGTPVQVQVLQGANVSKNNVTTAGGFVDDTWRPHPRLTVSLGLRFDRYQPSLPDQEGPAGETFAAVDPVLTFNNWSPRAGASADLTGDGKTVLKLHYGNFWVYPTPLFTTAINPNPAGWLRTSLWATDANANGRWDAGEEGPLVSVVGGSAATRLDPDIENTHVHQASVYLEREVVRNVGVRTGVVLNAKRQPFGTVNINRPLGGYSVPIGIADPGPDGRPGSADDGGTLTASNLGAGSLRLPPINLTTNLPHGDSDYYTWEITAARRQTSGWSLLASFTHTWSREAALGSGDDFTPNALINASGTQDHFRTWQAKVSGAVHLPWSFLVVPVVRHQSGTSFARTFVQTLNYGTATIKAEPMASNRTPNISIVDLRTEKVIPIKQVRLMGFVDVYNIFNTNAPQTLTTSSGGSWLRPTAITGPRILRIGARAEW